ncbi:MAG: TVP38/TMEM64 family protein [Rhodospirillales bacterium]|nr:TVP38/TMEM64 family protein [Rhodospirillales bacterium]
MTSRPFSSRVIGMMIRGLVMIAVFVLAGLVLREVDQGSLFDSQWIDTEVRSQGLAGKLIFVVAATLFTSFGLPRQIVCFLGGYAFGFLAGSALALGATVMGCGIAALFARFMGRDLVVARLPTRIQAADVFFRDHPFSLTLLIRLLPVGSNLATNLVAGLSSANLWPFLAASALGHLPQTVVFALIGSGINVDPEIRITMGVVLFILSMLIGMRLYLRFRRDGAFKTAIAAVVGNGENENATEPDGKTTATGAHNGNG